MSRLIGLAVTLAFAIWVAIDAHRLGVKRRCLGGGFADMGVVGWFFSVWLIWIIGFPLYLATRGKYVARRNAMVNNFPNAAPGVPVGTWAPGAAQVPGAPGSAFGYPGAGYGPPGQAYGAPGQAYGAPPSPPPGWYLDPSSSGGYRWWDGYRWGAEQAPPPSGR